MNAAGSDGLIGGDVKFFGLQVAAAAIVAAYAFVVTWLILKILDRFEPVRVPDDIEAKGLDSEMQEEEAYILA